MNYDQMPSDNHNHDAQETNNSSYGGCAAADEEKIRIREHPDSNDELS